MADNHEYKNLLCQIVEDPCWGGYFKVPAGGTPREFPLENRCRADFGYEFPLGRLFIEDDNANTAMSNLVKYEVWCAARPTIKTVYLIHIIGVPGQSRFLGEAISRSNEIKARLQPLGIRFEYRHVVHVGYGEWHNPKAKWLSEVRSLLETIVHDNPGAGLTAAA